MKEDISRVFMMFLKSCAQISQSAGGIGLSIHDIRAKGSYIKGTNGHPMELFQCCVFLMTQQGM